MKITRCLLLITLLAACSVAVAQGESQSAGNEPADLVKQGRKLANEGHHQEALEIYRKALAASPNHHEAHLEAGIALDMLGQYDEARKHLAKAIELAPPQAKGRALRTMGFSYAFERNGAGAEKYHRQVFDERLAKQDFEGAAGVANELARLLLESNDIDGAEKWYRTGYETAQRKPNMPENEKALWQFRWEHAQARIAARRGQKDAAQKHVAAAKAALDKAANPDQAPYFPYLTGYVAFYGGDYKTALAELQKADQGDPFILALIAQSYEKLGDNAKATEFYRQVLKANFHNPTNAYARPLAQKKLQNP